MFEPEIKIIETGLGEWIGAGMYVALYFVSIIYIFLKCKSNIIKNVFGTSAFIIFFIILNPIFTYCVKSVFTYSVYWRLFFTLPIGVAMAYVAVDIIYNIDEKINKFFIGFVLILLIIISGSNVYTSENYQEVDNFYKVPDETLLLVNLILDDQSTEYKKVMISTECVPYVRQITSKIDLMYGRNPTGYEGNELINHYEEGDVEYIASNCKANKCNYIVMKKDIDLNNEFANFEYDYYAETPNYTIFKAK